jgi:cation transport ATPase
VWQALEDYKTSAGVPLIDALIDSIERDSSQSPALLCAMAPEAPQATLLALINALKRLTELKKESRDVENKLHGRQEEDFQGIIDRWFVQSEASEFPLGTWLKLQPQMAARRYSFVGGERELLRKAEQFFADVRAKREAERVRLQKEEEDNRRQKEAERLRHERESEERRRQRQRQTARGCASIGIVIACTAGGTLAIGGVAAIIGAIGWIRVFAVIGVVAMLAWPSVLRQYKIKHQRVDYQLETCFVTIATLLLLPLIGLMSWCAGVKLGVETAGSADAASNFAVAGGIVGCVAGLIAGIVILIKRN